MPAMDDNVTNGGMVSGTISDFMEDGEPLHNWHIELNNASLGAIGQMPAGLEDQRS